jgi:hypothetical protein
MIHALSHIHHNGEKAQTQSAPGTGQAFTSLYRLVSLNSKEV